MSNYTTKDVDSLTVWNGEDLSLTFEAEFNLTGMAIEWNLSSEKGSGTVHVSKTTGGGGVTISTTSFTVTVTDTEIEAVGVGKFFHEAKRTDAGNETQLVAPSPLIIAASGIT